MATFKSGTTALSSKSVYHCLNSVCYNDSTIYTDASGKITFTQKRAAAGARL
jgi:hypothetical protein